MNNEQLDYLSIEDLLEIAAAVVGDVTVTDPGLLASAAARPLMSVFGADAYPTLEEKAAALLHSLVRNHTLLDGNKRLAWAATRIFCLLNGRDLSYSVDDAEALMVDAATGRLGVPQIAPWLARRLGPGR